MKFNIKVVTPMFMGGKTTKIAEVRSPSIKGALRWWFRAIYGKDTAEERLLWGGRDQKQGKLVAGQLRMHIENFSKSEKRNSLLLGSEKMFSYIGYGLINWNKQKRDYEASREFIPENSEFNLVFIWRESKLQDSKLQDRHIRQLLLSLWALYVFGGLGSRSRRGWGSIRVKPLSSKMVQKYLPELKWEFENAQELCEQVNNFVNIIKQEGVVNNHFPDFTQFSTGNGARILISEKTFDKWTEALNNIGDKLGGKRRSFRYNSFNKDIIAILREKFEKGHIIKPSEINQKYQSADPKAAFGLPHNYFFRSPDRYRSQPDKLINVAGEVEDRRASPMLISITELKNNKYVWVVTYLPAKFLANSKRLKMDVKEKRGKEKPRLVATFYTGIPNMKLVEEFLNDELKPHSKVIKV